MNRNCSIRRAATQLLRTRQVCSRFALTCSSTALRTTFAIEEPPDIPQRFNIAPTQPIAIIRATRTGVLVSNRHALVRWGFLPSFVKVPSDFPLLFNAKAEGLDQKQSFRNALRRRRCLIPASAFYLWRQGGNEKSRRSQPFMGWRSDAAPMGLAGLYETWSGPNGEEVDTACIVTTAANGVSAAIHARLPVVIEPADIAIWLNPDEAATDDAVALLKPSGNHVLRFVPITDVINSVRSEGPATQIAVGPPVAQVQGALRQASLF